MADPQAEADSYVMRLCGDCRSGPPCRCSSDPAVISREWISGTWVWIATCTPAVTRDTNPTKEALD